jgi:hypothetical protein
VIALAAVTCIAIAAVAGLVFLTVRARLMPAPSLVKRTVVVHTRRPDDQSIRGVVVAQHADRLILKEAAYLHGAGSDPDNQPILGLAQIPFTSISWMQEVGDRSKGCQSKRSDLETEKV